MDKYSIKYMETHCIDVFFTDGKNPIHIMTAGSIIPDELNDILRNRTLQEEIERNEGGAVGAALSINNNYISELVQRHNSVVNEYIQRVQGNNASYPAPDDSQISSHFRYYASQGFYSYDCTEVREDGTAVYRLMAWPEQAQQMKYNLPKFQPQSSANNNTSFPCPEYLEM